MDKSWISLPRSTTEYKIGLHQFLDFAFARSSVNGEIACPCPKCKFKRWQVRSVVYEHCIIRQFPRKYLFWVQHGEYDYVANNLEIGSSSHVGREIGGTDNNVEEYQTNENVQDDEMLAIEANENVQEEDVIGPESCILQNDIAKNFFDLMKDDVPLYPG